jgi:hypothetical protein
MDKATLIVIARLMAVFASYRVMDKFSIEGERFEVCLSLLSEMISDDCSEDEALRFIYLVIAYTDYAFCLHIADKECMCHISGWDMRRDESFICKILGEERMEKVGKELASAEYCTHLKPLLKRLFTLLMPK